MNVKNRNSKFAPSKYTRILPVAPKAYLFYNAFSGAMVILNQQYYKFFEKVINNEVPESEIINHETKIKFLIDNRFLVYTDTDELAEVKLNYWQAKFDKTAFNMSIMPTFKCNFNCIYCFVQKRPISLSNQMEKSLNRFLEENIPHHKLFHIDWYGGEPLLECEQIVRVSLVAKNICVRYKVEFMGSATTNGWLLTPKTARKLLSVGINTFQVTIDGVQEIHDSYRKLATGEGSFTKILENLRKLPDEAKLNVRINVSPSSLDRVPELINILYENDIRNTTLHIKAIVPSSSNACSGLYLPIKEFASRVLPIYKYAMDRGYRLDFLHRIFCPNFLFCSVDNISQFIMTPEGYLYKCSDAFGPSDSIGELKESGKITIHSTIYSRWFGKDAFRFGECRSCNILPLCAGGCTMKRIAKIDVPCSEYRYNLNELLMLSYNYKHLLDG